MLTYRAELKKHHILSLMILIFSSLALAACSHVPLMTIAKLRNFDMMKTDPGALRIAVKYPDTIHIPEGGATMLLQVARTSDEEVLLREEIEFERVDSNSEKAELSAELQEGWRVDIFRIPEENVPFFHSFQNTLLKMSEKDHNAFEGNLEIGVSGCSVSPEKPADIRITTFLKAPELGSYITLVRNVNLEAQLKELGMEGAETIEPCKGFDPQSDS